MNIKNKFKVFATLSLLAVSCLAISEPRKGRTFFRYTNDQGVKVINHTIPPKYAQRGYEVVNATGQVLRVIPPAPSEEELAKADAERQAQKRYSELRKRYKSVEEIESAKQRRLKSIDTNIAILKANIHSLDSQLNQLASLAAQHEREGRDIPAPLLEKIDVAKAEKSVAKDSLKKRQQEYQNVENQFDQDISAFSAGLAMFQQ